LVDLLVGRVVCLDRDLTLLGHGLRNQDNGLGNYLWLLGHWLGSNDIAVVGDVVRGDNLAHETSPLAALAATVLAFHDSAALDETAHGQTDQDHEER
jgi:hypothetical protein